MFYFQHSSFYVFGALVSTLGPRPDYTSTLKQVSIRPMVWMFINVRTFTYTVKNILIDHCCANVYWSKKI